MATDSPLGTKIRRARERHQWTQADLATKIGVSQKTIDNWENGRTEPKNRLGAIEHVLGINLTDEEPEPATPTDPEERALWDVLGDMNMDPADRWRVIGAAREARRQRATG